MSRRMREAAPSGADPYSVLGVGRRATDAEIKRAYFAQVRLHTPEREPEKFQEIRAAYERLRTPEARARSNLFLLQPPPELPRRRQPAFDLRVHFEDVAALAWTLLLARLAPEEEFSEPAPTEERGR